MSDQRLGAAIRQIRRRRHWRQHDLALRAGVSQPTISRLERGHLESITVGSLRRVGAAIDLRVDLVGRWRAGDLDRLLNARHSALHERVARQLAAMPGWLVAPEASFSVYGERGVIDVLAWHERAGALLIVELKTEIADLNELLGTLDRKRRLAPVVARERGWEVSEAAVSTWLAVADGQTNRRRIGAHRTMLAGAFDRDGRAIGGWLRRPAGRIRCLSFVPNRRDVGSRRIRRRTTAD